MKGHFKIKKYRMNLKDYTYKIIGLAMEVHSHLGPGMLESTYQACLFYELEKAGFNVKKELCQPLKYKEIELDKAYRIDLLIDEKIVIEVKAVEKTLPVHEAQILTYMKLGGYSVGLMINFNSKSLMEGIQRFVR